MRVLRPAALPPNFEQTGQPSQALRQPAPSPGVIHPQEGPRKEGGTWLCQKDRERESRWWGEIVQSCELECGSGSVCRRRRARGRYVRKHVRTCVACRLVPIFLFEKPQANQNNGKLFCTNQNKQFSNP
jgi:hypothetical protein